MKKGDFVIIVMSLKGSVDIYKFGKDKLRAENCYKTFVGDIVTLYVVDEQFIGDAFLLPIKTRKREE